MNFRLAVFTTLMLSNNFLVGGTDTAQCPPCPAKKKNGAIVKGRCKNAAGDGSSKEYKVTTVSDEDRCNEDCQIEGDACRGWAIREDEDTDNCLFYSYVPTKVKKGKNDAEDFQCYIKGTLRDYSFVGDGLCQPTGTGGKFTQLRSYRGGEIDDQNPLGTIDSIEQCAEFCSDNENVEDAWNYEPSVTKCEGFNFENERCINSFGETSNRCSTNCYLYAVVPTGNRTRPSRVRNYDGWTCYASTPGSGCSCD
jgi:hypothetical protein